MLSGCRRCGRQLGPALAGRPARTGRVVDKQSLRQTIGNPGPVEPGREATPRQGGVQAGSRPADQARESARMTTGGPQKGATRDSPPEFTKPPKDTVGIQETNEGMLGSEVAWIVLRCRHRGPRRRHRHCAEGHHRRPAVVAVASVVGQSGYAESVRTYGCTTVATNRDR